VSRFKQFLRNPSQIPPLKLQKVNNVLIQLLKTPENFLASDKFNDLRGNDLRGDASPKINDLQTFPEFSVDFSQSSVDFSQRSQETADFVIITALKEEFEAVLSKFSNLHKFDDTQYIVEVSTTRHDTTVYRVVVACLGLLERKVGHTIAAIKTSLWVKHWQPRYVLLVGIAAGVPGRYPINLGDVIIPKKIIDSGVKTVAENKQWKPDWNPYRVDNTLFNKCNLPKWYNYIEVQRPQSRKLNPICHTGGTIISGNEKINDPTLVEFYKTQWPDLFGIEMEAGGVAMALEETEKELGKNTGLLMIRAISDFGDKNKNFDQNKWESYACDAAASYTIAFLKNAPIFL
jgi:nucleoside phosphorylase